MVLEAGTETEVIEEGYLPLVSHGLLSLLFFFLRVVVETNNYFSRSGIVYSGLDSLTSIVNQENAS